MAKKKKKLTGRFKFFVLFACAVYTLVIFFMQESNIRSQKQEMSDLQQQKEQAIADNEFAQQNMLYITSNDYIEKVAREKLGWVTDGEIKFIQKNK